MSGVRGGCPAKPSRRRCRRGLPGGGVTCRAVRGADQMLGCQGEGGGWLGSCARLGRVCRAWAGGAPRRVGVSGESLTEPLPPGRGGAGRHGAGQAGQQEDPVQPAAGPRGPALSHVQPPEHGEGAAAAARGVLCGAPGPTGGATPAARPSHLCLKSQSMAVSESSATEVEGFPLPPPRAERPWAVGKLLGQAGHPKILSSPCPHERAQRSLSPGGRTVAALTGWGPPGMLSACTWPRRPVRPWTRRAGPPNADSQRRQLGPLCVS